MTTTRRRAAATAITATFLLVAATACGSESTDSTPAADTLVEREVDDTVGDAATTSDTVAGTAETVPARDGGAVTTPPDVVVPEALQFTAPLVGGGTFDGAAAAGKPTVFWFWAPT